MKRPLIIGLGEVLWDMLPTGKQLGGAPANVALHAQQLGAEAVVVSAVGNDVLGNEIIEKLNKRQVRHCLTKTAQATGIVAVKMHQGIPEYTIAENVAWDHIQYTQEIKLLIGRIAGVSFGSLAQRSQLSRQTIHMILSQISESTIKLFDINIRQYFYTKETISISLHASNVLKINVEELGLLSALFQLPTGELEKLRAISHIFNIKLIALTKGEKGSILYTDREISCLKACPVQVVDTIGAGDAFSAALLMGLVRKKSLNLIHEQATKVSAYVCSQYGATPQLPRKLIY